MLLYNFEQYKKTHDLNWFIIGYDGRQTKIANSELQEIEEKITNEYYEAINDRSFQILLQKYAKISSLQTKYQVVKSIILIMSNGFGTSHKEQEVRANLINELNNWGYRMQIMATPLEDARRLLEIDNLVNGLKTKISLIEQEIQSEKKKDSVSFQKQLLIIEKGIQLGRKINPRETTVLEWIEMTKLMEEIAKQN